MQAYIHAVDERGGTMLHCDRCGKSEPLDRSAWEAGLNAFVARHYHMEIDDVTDD